MKLNQTYFINIVGRQTENGKFIVVEKFNNDSSQHFQNYYKKLLLFNKCGEWFQALELYPSIKIGEFVIVQVDESTNLWARGIISKINNDSRPEIYLIDSQRFCNVSGNFELRYCPSRFANLVLPSYSIDLGLENDDLQNSAIEMLLKDNQLGELDFNFIPQSVENNVYSGKLFVNYKIDNLSIPLKKLLKKIHTKKYLKEILEHKQHNLSIFNPLNVTYMEHIFIPRNLNKSTVSSSEYSSCDDLASTSDFYEYLTRDEAPKLVKSRHNNPIIVKHKVRSFANSSLTHSSSLEKECITDLNSIIDNIYESIIQSNTFHKEPTVQEPSAVINTTITDVMDVVSTNSSEFDDGNFSDVLSEIESDSKNYIIDQIKVEDISEKKTSTLADCLSDTEFQHTNDSIPNQNETLKLPSTLKTNGQPINSLDDDSHIWWSSDDES